MKTLLIIGLVIAAIGLQFLYTVIEEWLYYKLGTRRAETCLWIDVVVIAVLFFTAMGA